MTTYQIKPHRNNTVVYSFATALMLITAIILSPGALADDFVDLMWDDLQPPVKSLEEQLQSTDSLDTPPQFSPSGAVVPELNGKRIRIPGYVVPLDGDDDSLSELLFVPYFGACIHVPPPPPNQIIYINSDEDIDVSKLDLYEPVWATGVLVTESLQHELAEVGYQMEIESLTRYDARAAKQREKQALRK